LFHIYVPFYTCTLIIRVFGNLKIAPDWCKQIVYGNIDCIDALLNFVKSSKLENIYY